MDFLTDELQEMGKREDFVAGWEASRKHTFEHMQKLLEYDKLKLHSQRLAEGLENYICWATGDGHFDRLRAFEAVTWLAEYRKEFPK